MRENAFIIVNLGSPDFQNAKGVEDFLFEFLNDAHVLSLPKFLRYPLAKRISVKRAQSYAKKLESVSISSASGKKISPLVFYTRKLSEKISEYISEEVLPAYRYGGSLENCVSEMRMRGAKNFYAIPLYPQNAYSTTQSARDAFFKLQKKGEQFYFGKSYFDDPDYISALCESLFLEFEKQKNWDSVIAAFHAAPLSHLKITPYLDECEKTFSLLESEFLKSAKSFGKAPSFHMAWCSQMGNEKRWTSPSLENLAKELAIKGAKEVALICPGFACDCTETLIDAKVRCEEIFKSLGGKKLHFVPCLNSGAAHAQLIAKIFKNMLLQSSKNV